MSIIAFDANNRVVIDNGLAYNMIAGGATSYIRPTLKWFTGNHYTSWVAMLISNDIPTPLIVALVAIRSAIAGAMLNHQAELGDICDATANPPALRLNAAEVIGNGDLPALTQYAALPAAEYNLAHFTAVGQALHGAHVAVPVNYVADRIPPNVQAEMVTLEMRTWAEQCAKLTYTILAINGFGLIMNSHHYRGTAASAASTTMAMYGYDKKLKSLALAQKVALEFIFHDALHPLSYEHVALWANQPPAAVSGKIAPTIKKRLPAYPGGVTFVQRAMTVRRQMFAAVNLANLIAQLDGSAADQRLIALDGAIRANVLDYNSDFRPVQYLAAKAGIDGLVRYAVALFGIYDRWTNKHVGDSSEGPTKGDGMKKLVADNQATYQAAVELCSAALNTAGAINIQATVALLTQ